jgi:hypothetical protein
MADNYYRVEWVIDIDSATSPEDAARQAWKHMRAEGSIANVFTVICEDGSTEQVDLQEIDEENASV